MELPNQILEDVLNQYKPVIGSDFERYKNHVCRVFLNCLLIDGDIENRDKYAIAAVFHDIGIWTNHTFDYLNPSIEQAKIYLHKTGRQAWTGEISRMIYWHHKLSAYTGENENTVENFRKADWMDVSLGLLTFGLNRHSIGETRHKFPNEGFHVFLLKESVQNFFKHPLNPLPVFKK